MCHLHDDERRSAERNAPPIPRARDYFEIQESCLPPNQVRSDAIRPT